MTRQQLEHIIRASANIADDDELVIIGSQSILGQFPDAPADLRVSVEADVFPKNRPERWDLIDGSIGEGSPFHETYGYYAQGVAEDTATLPARWKERLVPIKNENTRGATGLCLDVHDLVISKYVADREKDDHFVWRFRSMIPSRAEPGRRPRNTRGARPRGAHAEQMTATANTRGRGRGSRRRGAVADVIGTTGRLGSPEGDPFHSRDGIWSERGAQSASQWSGRGRRDRASTYFAHAARPRLPLFDPDVLSRSVQNENTIPGARPRGANARTAVR